MLDSYWLSQNTSIKDRLNNLRKEISDAVNVLLAYREYLSDKQFEFVNEVAKSQFISAHEIIPNDSYLENGVEKPIPGNQDIIGECIFNLYEKSAKIYRILSDTDGNEDEVEKGHTSTEAHDLKKRRKIKRFLFNVCGKITISFT